MNIIWIFYIGFGVLCSASFESFIRNSIKDYFTPVKQVHEEIIWTKKKKSELPNIILIVADDLGFNDVRDSPNIKSIYQNGIKFNNAYAAHATCAPSRAALFTGRFPTKLGLEFTPHPASMDFAMHFQNGLVHNNIVNFTTLIKNPSMEYMSLNKNETLVSNVLKKHNYTNYFVGKWHLGELDGYRPLERGFDESLAFLYGASMYGENEDPNIVSTNITKSLFDTYISKWIPFGISHNNKQMIKPNEYLTDYLSNSVIKIIKNEHNSPDPFFITLAYNAPHNPYQALKSDYESETGEHNEKIYKAMIKAVDRGVGNIIQTLKDEEKYDNTLIMFTSDNGGTHLIELDDINYPYNGWKCTFFEGGIKVPMFWQWPNKISPNSQFNKTVSHVDIFSTISSLVNYVDKSNSEIDGVNLMPHILNNKKDEIHNTLFWRSADYKTIKHNKWKLSISDKMNKSWFFDLDKDPQELNNLMKDVYTNGTVRYYYDIIYERLIETNKDQQNPMWNSPMMMAIPIYSSSIKSKEDDYVYWSI